MMAVVEGFSAVIAIIVLGAVLAHTGFLTYPAQVMLTRLAFFVASPALMLHVLATAELTGVFSGNLVATTVAVAVTVAGYLALSRLVAPRHGAESIVATLCACYVNSANLGIPIAVYILGDATHVAPVILLQLLVLQPVALVALDRATAGAEVSIGTVLRRTLRNPLLLGALVGLVITVTGIEVPTLVLAPLGLLGDMAVPAMLLAYGVSLRLGPRPGAGTPKRELALLVGLKALVQPAVAYLVGAHLLGLAPDEVLAVTVLAALPTAQNVFVLASRYETAVTLTRDAIFVATVASVPAIVVIAALLG